MLEKKAKIAAVILGEAPVEDSRKARRQGADILELRLDQFKRLEIGYLLNTIKEIKKKTHLPVIATLRSRGEEKFLPLRHRISEKKRLEIILQILPLVDIVDIELSAKQINRRIISRAHSMNKKVIVSYHNFKSTPPFKKLASIVRGAKNIEADIVKIAAFAKNKSDIARLMVFTHTSARVKPLVTVSMGKLGFISRIVSPFFGSEIIYTAADKKSAPGQFRIGNVRRFMKGL